MVTKRITEVHTIEITITRENLKTRTYSPSKIQVVGSCKIRNFYDPVIMLLYAIMHESGEDNINHRLGGIAFQDENRNDFGKNSLHYILRNEKY